jgi:hypothetical protein
VPGRVEHGHDRGGAQVMVRGGDPVDESSEDELVPSRGRVCH